MYVPYMPGYNVFAHVLSPSEAIMREYHSGNIPEAVLTRQNTLVAPLPRTDKATPNHRYDPLSEVPETESGAAYPLTLPTAYYQLPAALRRSKQVTLRLESKEIGAMSEFGFVVTDWKGQAMRPSGVRDRSESTTDWHVSANFKSQSLGRIGLTKQGISIDRALVGFAADGSVAVGGELLLAGLEASIETSPALSYHFSDWFMALRGLYRRLNCPGFTIDCRQSHFSLLK